MMQGENFDKLPVATPPDVWFVYRTNPAISFWDTKSVESAMAKFPFTVCFAYTHDETNHVADVLLPDCTDLEGLQLLRIGGTKYVEQFWDYQGFALRAPAVPPQGEAMDFTWIATELANRTGLLEAYNAAINRGAAGVKLSGKNYDFALAPDKVHDVEAIWDASCRAASAEITDGVESQGLDWFREHGFRVKPFPRLQWYLYPKLVKEKLRFEQPYQEQLFRIGKELGHRLHEHDIHWWDKQLAEYEPFPVWHDLNALWEVALAKHYSVRIADYPFWLITARSMQYSWGGNVGIQIIKEVAENVAGHGNVVMNHEAASRLGIADGDLVEVRSPLNETKGHVMLCEGIRPDTLLMIGQFDHWMTPYAKDFHAPSMNALMPMLLDLTDATGSSADLVKVKITRLEARSPGPSHDALGHDRRSRTLRRLSDLHGGLQAFQRHLAGGAVAQGARHRGRQLSQRCPHLRAGRLPALRRSALHACLSLDRDAPARRRHRHHRLRHLHRLRLLRGGLPLSGALPGEGAALRL